jgi:hypothetical protein
MTMNRFKISLYINDEGKKITAIKELRSALGIGLTEAKQLVEANNDGHTSLIVNAEQVAGLVMISKGACSGGVDQPYIYVAAIERITPFATPVDYSDRQPY